MILHSTYVKCSPLKHSTICEKMRDDEFYDNHISYQLLKEVFSPRHGKKMLVPYDKDFFFCVCAPCIFCIRMDRTVDRTVFSVRGAFEKKRTFVVCCGRGERDASGYSSKMGMVLWYSAIR